MRHHQRASRLCASSPASFGESDDAHNLVIKESGQNQGNRLKNENLVGGFLLFR